MTDWNEFATRPDPGFEQQLERTLIDELFADQRRDAHASSTTRGTTTTRLEMDMSTVELEPDTKTTRRMRGLSLAAALALILVGGLVVLRIVRDDPSPTSDMAVPTVSVDFDTQWPPFGETESTVCIEASSVYLWAENGRCIRTFQGEAMLSGDITGSALWVMNANQGRAADPDDAVADITAAFNGTYLVRADVDGCGSGEFMIAEQLRFLGWASGQFVGSWQIIPGSGRGDLSSITGSGTSDAATTDDVDTARAHTGSVSCS